MVYENIPEFVCYCTGNYPSFLKVNKNMFKGSTI
jgi:hypothetical protein